MRPHLRSLFAPGRIPWTFVAAAAAATVIQLHPAWREALVYQRYALARGEWWRIWTGQLVHFGWTHFLTDTGLFLILGWLLEGPYPWLSRGALVAMPAAITAVIYLFEPAMIRYGGLSAISLGFLVFLACRGWQRNWFDWFWPAVLAIYVGEVVFEATMGHGHGGGLIAFDDPSIHVATVAHIASAACGVLLWLAIRRRPAAGPI